MKKEPKEKKVKEPKIVKLELTHLDLKMVKGEWTVASDSIDEVYIINLVQFLTPPERIHFVNELYRVMKTGARAQLSAPHWCSARAYGDMMNQWPPVSEAWVHHLDADWRKSQAPWGVDYKCDFAVSGGYNLHQNIITRNHEYQVHAITFFKEAAQDFLATLIKK